MITVLFVLFLYLINWSDTGLLYATAYLFTGFVCWRTEWSRNVMIGLYIVGGFWYMAAGAM